MKCRFYVLSLLATVIMMMVMPADALASSYTGQEHPYGRDRLSDAGRDRRDNGAAAFDDAVMPARTCLPRVVRSQPSFGPSPSTAMSRGHAYLVCPETAIPALVNNLESAPFRSAVSRLYYVIALRHILC